MTEDTIERMVEALTDTLDGRLMTGKMTQEEYDLRAAEIDKWAEAQRAGQRYFALRTSSYG